MFDNDDLLTDAFDDFVTAAAPSLDPRARKPFARWCGAAGPYEP